MIGQVAKQAALRLANATAEEKNNILLSIAKKLDAQRALILKENRRDVAEAQRLGLKPALLKRLELDADKIKEMVKQVKDVAKLEDPVGKTLQSIELDLGLELYQVSCPIGVIGAIFEARPDALVQIACLCLKSGNAVILKGGSEARNSNRVLAKVISDEADFLAKGAVQLVETREEVQQLLKMDQYIDLFIPRGSAEFVRFIQDNTRIAVLGHSAGVCHVYVDKAADLGQAVEVCFDAKCQYPAVCNAMETLLVHIDIAGKFLPLLVKRFAGKVELRGDAAARSFVTMRPATDEDWAAEYNDLILSVKIVKSVDEAIRHINRYGSRHSDAIITEDGASAKRFLSSVDASSVMWNCSTRFADGYRYGKGAEVGISTGKLHARGPVGLEGLTIYKYVLVGKHHRVADYVGKKAKRYTHRKVRKEWHAT
ncbi:MAG: glutamate-5-semialdehyde dehydrogenase [Nanoarchaeota archaeon]